MKTTPLASLLVAGLATSLHAGSPVEDSGSKAVLDGKAIVPPVIDTTWGGPVLGGGIKSNGELTDGSLFLVYPLLDTIGEGGRMEGSVLFLEPYVSWGDGGDIGASLGLGFRHLFSEQTVEEAMTVTDPGFFGEGVFVGSNLFLDYGNTHADNDFWQGGIGAEAGTRYLQVRANYYIPFSDDQTLDRYTTTEVHRTTSTSARSFAGAPTISGGQRVQNVGQRTTTTTRTTTTRTTYEVFEEGLQGWDLEMALLVPGLDEYMDLRLVGGYYHFEGDRSKSEIEGWRAGVELRPIPALVIHGTWYESDRLYEENWLAGVRVELPLEGMRDAFRMRRRHLAEHLFEPVRRKNSAIITNGTETEITSSDSSESTTTTTSTTGGTKVLGFVSPPEEEEEEEEGPFNPFPPRIFPNPGGGDEN